jgi:hypothetical protein
MSYTVRIGLQVILTQAIEAHYMSMCAAVIALHVYSVPSICLNSVSAFNVVVRRDVVLDVNCKRDW